MIQSFSTQSVLPVHERCQQNYQTSFILVVKTKDNKVKDN